MEKKEGDQGPQMSLEWIKKTLRADTKQYYSTPELNEVLYFHFKGFRRIENLNLFPDLKCIYLENNAFTSIEGLEANTALRCLYLHQNMIEKISGLSTLKNLKILNLSDNKIKKIEGLTGLSLENLQISKNLIGKDGLDDIKGLLECPSLTAIDLQKNYLADPHVLDEVFAKMPNLTLLYLTGNDATAAIPNYRKKMITSLPKLKYLDDKPVFEDDRRCAEAFILRGGLEAERAEKAKIKEEKEAVEKKNRDAFEQMLKEARLAREQVEKAKANSPEILQSVQPPAPSGEMEVVPTSIILKKKQKAEKGEKADEEKEAKLEKEGDRVFVTVPQASPVKGSAEEKQEAFSATAKDAIPPLEPIPPPEDKK